MSNELKIAIIGIGNAGNQVAAEASKHGYPTFIINSSVKDVSDGILHSSIPSYIIGDGSGCGKNRNIAKNYLIGPVYRDGRIIDREQTSLSNLFYNEIFESVVGPADVVFVVGSVAGGTGSGMSPMISYKLNEVYSKKVIIFFGIIPKMAESVRAHYNTIECINEVKQAGVPYMLADLDVYENLNNDVAYTKICKHIVDCIDAIKGKYTNISPYGMIDERDMLTIVSQPGYMAVYNVNGITAKSLETETALSMVKKAIKAQPNVRMQNDLIVKEMGIIVNMPREFEEGIKTGNYDELTDYVGTPLDIFENYSTIDKPTGQIVVILSGMTVPYDRIARCREMIEQHEENLKKAKDFDLSAEKERFSFLKVTPDSDGMDKILRSETEKRESDSKMDKALSEVPNFFK